MLSPTQRAVLTAFFVDRLPSNPAVWIGLTVSDLKRTLGM